jgi:hypothetical protein
MKRWLITNDETDPAGGLAPRYDLSMKKYAAFGLVDCKIVSTNTLRQNYVWAISGPSKSNGKFPAFDWSKWSTHSHLGMSEIFDFPWVKVSIQ